MENKCCNKQRVINALKSLGKEQLEIIIKEDKKAEIVCPNCNTKYYFNEIELNNILKSIKKNKE